MPAQKCPPLDLVLSCPFLVAQVFQGTYWVAMPCSKDTVTTSHLPLIGMTHPWAALHQHPGTQLFVHKQANAFLILDGSKWGCWVLVVGTFKILIATSKLPSPKAARVYTFTPHLSLNKFMGIVKYLHTHIQTPRFAPPAGLRESKAQTPKQRSI